MENRTPTHLPPDLRPTPFSAHAAYDGLFASKIVGVSVDGGLSFDDCRETCDRSSPCPPDPASSSCSLNGAEGSDQTGKRRLLHDPLKLVDELEHFGLADLGLE